MLPPVRTSRLILVSLLLLFLFVRLAYISRISLSGDEAVFGLMSFSIGRGEEYPLYCWGAHYASALISYIAVPVMAVLGPSPYAFKLPTLIYGATLVALIFVSLERRFGKPAAALSALAIALPVPVFLEYSVAAHGGYPETYFLGFAIWIAALDPAPRKWTHLLLGFLCGASFAILWLGIPFILSALVLLMVRRRLSLLHATGFLAGSLPFWIYNLLIAPGATFLRLGARSLHATAATPLSSAVIGKLEGIPAWIGMTQISIGVLLVGAWWASKIKNDWRILLLSFYAGLLCFNFAGGLTHARHWTPLLLALIVSCHGLSRTAARIFLLLLIAVGGYQSLDVIRHLSPNRDIDEAAAIIRTAGADALIADYDLGYPVAFALNGRIPVSATLAPNPSDRRPDWTRRISNAKRPAVLLPKNSPFEVKLAERGIAFQSHLLSSRTLTIVDAEGGTVFDLLR